MSANSGAGAPYQVQLYVYDLSQGLARQLSTSILGKQLDGIWHTAIVVYGAEFFYGGGLMRATPLATPFGKPVEIVDLGTTSIPEALFLEFLEEVSPRFTVLTYNLFTNNCNNFTNEASQFLLGRGIPEHIINLPNEALATPLGAMMRPMIDNIYGSLQQSLAQGINPMNPSVPFDPSAVHSALSGAITTAVPPTTGAPAAAAAPAAGAAPPAVPPAFPAAAGAGGFPFGDMMAGMPGGMAGMQQAMQALQGMGPATGYSQQNLDQLLSSFVGSLSQTALNGGVPLAPGASQYLPPATAAATAATTAAPAAVRHLALAQPALFGGGDVGKIFDKLQSYMTAAPAPLLDAAQTQLLEALRVTLAADKSDPSACGRPLPAGVVAMLVQLVGALPAANRFPALDILRLLALNPEGNRELTTLKVAAAFLRALIKALDQATKSEQLLTLRLAANLFAHSDGRQFMVANADDFSDAIVHGLLAPDGVCRRAASVVIFNTVLYSRSDDGDLTAKYLSGLHHVLSSASPAAAAPAAATGTPAAPAAGQVDDELAYGALVSIGKLCQGNEFATSLVQSLDLNLTPYLNSTTSPKLAAVAAEVKQILG